MAYTKAQMQVIKYHYRESYSAFRFRKDGSVEAKKSLTGAWGVLYTPWQAQLHLKTVSKSK